VFSPVPQTLALGGRVSDIGMRRATFPHRLFLVLMQRYLLLR
jgi:hypothetical protein